MTTRHLFRLTLPSKVLIKQLSMTFGALIQSDRVSINPLDEGVPQLLKLPPFGLELVVLKRATLLVP